jgi:hypothetical protein
MIKKKEKSVLMENGIPHHLKPYLIINKKSKNLNKNFIIKGKIRCVCGSETFTIIREKFNESNECKEAEKQISALLEKHKSIQNKGYLSMIEIKGNWYIADDEERPLEDITKYQNIILSEQIPSIYLEAICSQCGKKIIIFDSRKHGYDGLNMNKENDYINDFETIKISKCRKCNSDFSKIIVKISNTGKGDLLSEGNDCINNSNWEDAFDWITIDLKCGCCGKRTKNYIEEETM